VEYVLNDRDPRRYKPLVDFCISTALTADFQSGSAFDRESSHFRASLNAERFRSGEEGSACPIGTEMPPVAVQRLGR
jgi:hypothetical protein